MRRVSKSLLSPQQNMALKGKFHVKDVALLSMNVTKRARDYGKMKNENQTENA